MASIQFERAVIEELKVSVNEDRGGLQWDFKVNCLLDLVLASRLGIDEMLFVWRPAVGEDGKALEGIIDPGSHRDGFKRVDLTRELGAGVLTVAPGELAREAVLSKYIRSVEITREKHYDLRIEKADKMAAKVGEDVIWLTFQMEHVGDGEELINYFRVNGNGSATMTLELDQKELAF